MILRLLAAALLCVLMTHAVDAGRQRLASRLQEANAMHRPVPPDLQRIMTEGAGRVVNPNCDDVRAVVAWVGEARAEAEARAAGASEAQIRDAKRCLRN